MKRSFLLLLSLVACTVLSAQTGYRGSEKEANLEAMASSSGVYQKNSSIWLDGKRLSKGELSAMEGFDVGLYSYGRAVAGVGTALMSIGAVPCVLGTIGLAGTIQVSARIERDRKEGIEPTPGSGLPQVVMIMGYGSGVLLESLGLLLRSSGRSDIRHAAVSYNGQKYIQYSIGPSPSGFGIALYF